MTKVTVASATLSDQDWEVNLTARRRQRVISKYAVENSVPP